MNPVSCFLPQGFFPKRYYSPLEKWAMNAFGWQTLPSDFSSFARSFTSFKEYIEFKIRDSRGLYQPQEAFLKQVLEAIFSERTALWIEFQTLETVSFLKAGGLIGFSIKCIADAPKTIPFLQRSRQLPMGYEIQQSSLRRLGEVPSLAQICSKVLIDNGCFHQAVFIKREVLIIEEPSDEDLYEGSDPLYHSPLEQWSMDIFRLKQPLENSFYHNDCLERFKNYIDFKRADNKGKYHPHPKFLKTVLQLIHERKFKAEGLQNLESNSLFGTLEMEASISQIATSIKTINLASLPKVNRKLMPLGGTKPSNAIHYL